MKQLTPEQLSAWMREGVFFQLVDVREDFEREQFHIGGLHIPLGELMARSSELSGPGPYVLYCEKGIRSSIAIQRLEAAGHAHLYNLSGGMKQWKAEGRQHL